MDKGTEFKIYLPALQMPEMQQAMVEHFHLPIGSKELILVIDDEASVREITKAFLEAYNFKVVTAANGAEAIAIYTQQRGKIDAVVTNIMMPVMDGIKTVQALQQIDPQVKIIVVSGLVTKDTIAEVNKLGVNIFLPKPYTAKTLLTKLMEILRKEQRR